MTPHNEAKKGDIAKVVLMPGDPLRAKFIAETFLEDAVCFNTVRGMLGYTGLYNGKRVSVMGSGMGMPSMGIYSYELYHCYDVEAIIRIGTAGGIADGVELRFPVTFAVSVVEMPSYPCLQSLQAEECEKKEKNVPSLVLRAMKPGERLWDIAKRYRTTVEAILAANELKEESATVSGKLLLIPRRR